MNILKKIIKFPELWYEFYIINFFKIIFREGKWLKVNYRADKDGFHIINQQVVTEDELNQPSGGSAADHTASVETQVDGKNTAYTVKEEDLKKAAAKNKDKQQQGQHTAL